MKCIKTAKLFSLILLVLAALTFGQEKKIAIGPYVQNMSHESVTLCWSTIEGEISISSADGQTTTLPRYKQHEIRLTRLQPNRTYQYDVLKDGSAEGRGSFTTFPKEIKPFRFAVLGDTRTRHQVHQKIVNRIIDEKPLFVVNTGDLVSNGDNILDWQHFFRINHELMKNTPYFSVLGNHENDSKNYYNFFDLPGNEHYYNFSIGEALFIVLDGEGPDYNTPPYIKKQNRAFFWNNHNIDYFKKEKVWLENILTLHKDAGFIFVFMHEPLYSIKKSRLEGAKMRREFWGDIFERHNVQFFLSGHDHHYHHALHNGTHYVTTAGGGAPLYETDAPQPETIKFAKIEHYVTIEVGLEEATLTAIDIDGQTIEKIVAPKRQ